MKIFANAYDLIWNFCSCSRNRPVYDPYEKFQPQPQAQQQTQPSGESNYDEYDSEKELESSLPYGIQNVRDVQAAQRSVRNRKIVSQVFDITALNWDSICSKHNLTNPIPDHIPITVPIKTLHNIIKFRFWIWISSRSLWRGDVYTSISKPQGLQSSK